MENLSSNLAPVQGSEQPGRPAAALGVEALGAPPPNMTKRSGMCPVGGQTSVYVGVYALPVNAQNPVATPVFWVAGDAYYYTGGIQCSSPSTLTFSSNYNGSSTNVSNVTSIFITITPTYLNSSPWTVTVPNNTSIVNESCSIVVTDINGIQHDPMIVVTPG